MSALQSPEDKQEQLETEAVALVVRLNSGEAGQPERDEAESWRRRSTAHEQAYRKACRLWTGMEGLRNSFSAANSQKVPASVTPSHMAAPVHSRRRVGSTRWMRASALAATLAVCAMSFTFYSDFVVRLTADYRTGVGKQTLTILKDGSFLQLNTQAAVVVHYTEETRGVELLEGEASFRVVKDATRPFVVRAATGEIRAVGTEFLVHKTSDAVLVTVVEGAVELRTTPDGRVSGMSVRVEAGQRVRYASGGRVGPVEMTDLRIATAWQRGKLIFESMPLTTVVEEINRYRHGRIIILNPTLARHRVSGVFDLQRLDSAVSTIERTLPGTSMRLTDRFVFLR